MLPGQPVCTWFEEKKQIVDDSKGAIALLKKLRKSKTTLHPCRM
jgi:hypothetical protein